VADFNRSTLFSELLNHFIEDSAGGDSPFANFIFKVELYVELVLLKDTRPFAGLEWFGRPDKVIHKIPPPALNARKASCGVNKINKGG
jgi:hypothetical protein